MSEGSPRHEGLNLESLCFPTWYQQLKEKLFSRSCAVFFGGRMCCDESCFVLVRKAVSDLARRYRELVARESGFAMDTMFGLLELPRGLYVVGV